MFVGNSSFLCEILVEKYGPEVRWKSLLSSLSPPGFTSTWWKDLCLHGTVTGFDGAGSGVNLLREWGMV